MFVGFVCLKTGRFLFFGFTVASAAVGFIFAAAHVQPFQQSAVSGRYAVHAPDIVEYGAHGGIAGGRAAQFLPLRIACLDPAFVYGVAVGINFIRVFFALLVGE